MFRVNRCYDNKGFVLFCFFDAFKNLLTLCPQGLLKPSKVKVKSLEKNGLGLSFQWFNGRTFIEMLLDIVTKSPCCECGFTREIPQPACHRDIWNSFFPKQSSLPSLPHMCKLLPSHSVSEAANWSPCFHSFPLHSVCCTAAWVVL